jgi:hypothetical protein
MDSIGYKLIAEKLPEEMQTVNMSDSPFKVSYWHVHKII